MKIVLTERDATEILTDLFFNLVNNELALGQGKISVEVELVEDE